MVTDAFDWTWHSGSTPTMMTGPSADHTGGEEPFLSETLFLIALCTYIQIHIFVMCMEAVSSMYMGLILKLNLSLVSRWPLSLHRGQQRDIWRHFSSHQLRVP